MLKVAFLFLTIANVYHERYWKEFFRGHEGRYSIYVHAKNRADLTSAFFKPYLIPHYAPTSWAHTMNAQLELLRQALTDSNNSKFVFLSETTIPLRGFRTVYKRLTVIPNSQFFITKNPHLTIANKNAGNHDVDRKVPGIPMRYQKKHTQWIVLNRKHAQALINAHEYLNHKIFCDNEHFPGTILASQGYLKEIAPLDTTYVNWNFKGPNGRVPFTFTDLSNINEYKIAQGAIKQGFLFARKFSQECDLTPLDHLLLYRKRRKSSRRPL